ncbi:hypothetical protein L6R52_03140 [Myxococcota bacterium]|nr:hypothetical protein [Myxococcota bacterium]
MEPAKIIDEVCAVLREQGRPMRARELVAFLGLRGVAITSHELDAVLFAPGNERPGLSADRSFRWSFGAPTGATGAAPRARGASTTRGAPPRTPSEAPSMRMEDVAQDDDEAAELDERTPPAIPAYEPLVRRPNPFAAADARLSQTFAKLSDANRELRQTRMRLERVEDMLTAVTRELGQLKNFVAREKDNFAKNQQGPEPGGFSLSSELYDLTYREARRRAIEQFELAYAQELVAKHGGNVTRAADAAEVHRNVLHRILARTKDDGDDDVEGAAD